MEIYQKMQGFHLRKFVENYSKPWQCLNMFIKSAFKVGVLYCMCRWIIYVKSKFNKIKKIVQLLVDENETFMHYFFYYVGS